MRGNRLSFQMVRTFTLTCCKKSKYCCLVHHWINQTDRWISSKSCWDLQGVRWLRGFHRTWANPQGWAIGHHLTQASWDVSTIISSLLGKVICYGPTHKVWEYSDRWTYVVITRKDIDTDMASFSRPVKHIIEYICISNNTDRKSTRLNSSHVDLSRMPSSAW